MLPVHRMASPDKQGGQGGRSPPKYCSMIGFGGQNLQPASSEGGRDTGIGRSSSI